MSIFSNWLENNVIFFSDEHLDRYTKKSLITVNIQVITSTNSVIDLN